MNNRSTHIRHVSLGYRLITWLWAGTLLLSTVGVSVHAVYCYCSGQTNYSLLSPPKTHVCAVEKKESCCQAPAKKAPKNSCCASPATPTQTPTCDIADEKGCMKNTTYTFVLKTDLQVEKTIEKVFLPNLGLFSPEIPAFEFIENSDFYPAYFPIFPLPPPAVLSGRMICIRHQLFLC